MDWQLAFKIGGPSAIAAWLFHALVTHYLGSSGVFKDSIFLNVLLIVVIFVFCLSMGWLWIKRNESSEATPTSIKRNEVVDNEVSSNLEIGSSNAEIKNNKIKRNKVNGNLKIG